MAGIGEGNDRKRKQSDGNEIEIDFSAPEPPSKKALRKAKKKGVEPTTQPAEEQKQEQKQKELAKEEDAPKPRSDYGIWIGNLAFSVSKDDLRRFFTTNCSFADTAITRLHMPKGTNNYGRLQNKGFAYVDFSTPRALQEALGLNEYMLVGRRVLIKDSRNFEGRPEKQQEEPTPTAAASSGHPPSKRIFVGNLGFDATKETLEEHFGQCGNVTNVRMATFQDTGKCKGYAWVGFDNVAAAETAVKGFVMVDEEDEAEEEEEDSDTEKRDQSKPKKPRQKRVWVNQLLGRRMRMEFAEDPTTRYNKRFGKVGQEKKKDNYGAAEDGSYEENSTGEPSAPAPLKKTKQDKPDYTRYDEGTVQKLSGSIVESKGKKVTFD